MCCNSSAVAIAGVGLVGLAAVATAAPGKSTHAGRLRRLAAAGAACTWRPARKLRGRTPRSQNTSAVRGGGMSNSLCKQEKYFSLLPAICREKQDKTDRPSCKPATLLRHKQDIFKDNPRARLGVDGGKLCALTLEALIRRFRQFRSLPVPPQG